MGEASRNLPGDFREQHPEMPWQEIIGLGNRLAHAYFNVSLEIVWEVVAHELGSLEENINAILARTEQA